VRRKSNKLADILANQGVSCNDNRVSMGWQVLPQGSLKLLCHNQTEEDREVSRNKAKAAKSK